MFGDEITLTLNSPLTDEEFDAIMDVDMENTPSVIFHTKNGKEVFSPAERTISFDT